MLQNRLRVAWVLLKKQLRKLVKLVGLESIFVLWRSSGLKANGWFESFKKKQSVDKLGNPIPWCTYSFIKFVEPRLKKEFAVFEYGCGSSTLWYAARLSSVISVEHDFDWYKIVKSQLPSNADVRYRELETGGDYSKEILNTSKKYEIIVIDGRDRINCVRNSIGSLKEDGIIIFDNSDRVSHQDAYNLLEAKGFKRLDFWGMGPIGTANWCTSIFYRNRNCLGI